MTHMESGRPSIGGGVRTAGLAVLLLLIFIVLAEAAARSGFLRKRLPTPSMGVMHRFVDAKVSQLDDLIAREGPVDCIIFGNSMVNRGIDPEIVGAEFEELTGRPLKCFNFGLGGMLPGPASAMVGVLVERYRPPVMIWGLSSTEFAVKVAQNLKKQFRQSPWVGLHNGRWSLDGWLVEHSSAYRYFLRFRIWMERPRMDRKMSAAEGALSTYGQYRVDEVAEEVGKPLDLEKDKRYGSRLQTPEVRTRRLRSMEKTLEIRSRTGVVVMEMPVHPTLLSALNRGSNLHEIILGDMAAIADAAGVEFWPSSGTIFIPDEGWSDRYHLNPEGATLFSRWVGRRAAASPLLSNLRGGR